ncbi:energy-coupling factor transport system ATP-binding protein [Agromyces sp. CF514]|uniref:ATP-binding cassette domain-containing protein n=1 Tax=Agromyces sp. CF514 TaxID=1881031 RepID=UPI0008EF394F|nr:ATP-binding cassette domain-containing protein [Agromyces sp. CF514]SFR69063.1 energy-coupling factor transport system ATP-binding protein [Agromyces sp. CF514]
MTIRPAPLRTAAIIAAGFVGARVVYRVLFHGADGTGPVVLPLPEIPLPRPFSHVVLLGPATVDGLADAAASAVPIALAILAFGVLNAVLDVPRLLVRGARRGPMRGVARTLAVAWAGLPALADAVRRVRFAQRLRGERGGPRLLAPVLERTLERATAVAAALELRGLAGRADDAVDGACERPVEARHLAIVHRDAQGATVVVPSLELAPGTLTLVTGATGSGKSTLLRTLAGLHAHLDGGTAHGELLVVGLDRSVTPPRDTARTVGVVLQHPREGFATERVDDEIGLALELRGVDPVIVRARVDEVAARVGIRALLGRELRGLSAGEATLVAIAASIAEHPILLLVDEPLADLDLAMRQRIVALLDSLAHEAGICVVVAEHRQAEFAAVADARVAVADGLARPVRHEATGTVRTPTATSAPSATSAPATAATSAAGSYETAAEPLAFDRRARETHGEVVLRARALTVRHGATIAVDAADLDLASGEIVALTGPNGAGKSSLLIALATGRTAAVTMRGTPSHRMPPHGMRARWTWAHGASPDGASAHRGRRDEPRDIVLVPDTSDDLFAATTVAAECIRADRRARLERGTTAARFAAFLGSAPGDADLAARLERHPRDLSVGERRCLAIAIQSAGTPSVVLVDEPTRGLDAHARRLVASALCRAADEGAAVLVATHDAGFVEALADRKLPMDGGRLGRSEPAASWLRRPGGDAATSPASPASPASRIGSTAQAEAADDAPSGFEAEERRGAGAPRSGSEEQSAGDAERARTTSPRAATRVPPYVGSRSRRRGARGIRSAALVLTIANLVALAAFTWPLVATALPEQASAAVPVAALALAPLATLVVLAALDGSVRSAHTLALLGTLAAIGAAVRIAGTGVGGVEAVFILLILAGRAFGPRFGLLLGLLTIALSTIVTGTFGPWTPFQMFACAWVGAGAGLLPRRLPGRAEIAMLAVYGVLASYAFGLIMNLWFWPFAIGTATSIAYEPGAPLGQNLSSFLLYSLVTSSLTWDTLRAITTVVGLTVIGSAVLASFRRAKPVGAGAGRSPDGLTAPATARLVNAPTSR